MSADIIPLERDATPAEVEAACDDYCRTAWGRPLESRASVQMFMSALRAAGFRIVRGRRNG